MLKSGSTKSILVGRQQPVCFVNLFSFLLVPNQHGKHLVAFHLPFPSDSENNYFCTQPLGNICSLPKNLNLNPFVSPTVFVSLFALSLIVWSTGIRPNVLMQYYIFEENIIEINAFLFILETVTIYKLYTIHC